MKIRVIGEPYSVKGSDAEEKALAMQWENLANCRGVEPDLFFPERGASTKEARKVCLGRIVREDYLDYALESRQLFGIWGGLSERKRRRIRRAHNLARAQAELNSGKYAHAAY